MTDKLSRKYTPTEVDEMRACVETLMTDQLERYSFYTEDGYARDNQKIEDRLRTYLLAGIAPSALKNRLWERDEAMTDETDEEMIEEIRECLSFVSSVHPDVQAHVLSLARKGAAEAKAEAKLAKARGALLWLSKSEEHNGLVVGQIYKMENFAAAAYKDTSP